MTDEIPSNEVVLTEPVAEKTVIPAEKFDGLSNREALKESIAYHNEGKELPTREVAPTKDTTISKTEVKQAVEADLEPPQGFSKEAQEAWKNKDIPAVQKEFKRIRDASIVEITRAQTSEREARREAKEYSDLDNFAAEYIKERAKEGIPKAQAMREAFQLIYEFKKGDPATVKAELKNAGIDLDKPSTQTPAQALTPEIESLQKTVKELKDEREDRRFQENKQLFTNSFATLTAQKTRTGECVFPGLLDNSDAGIKFAEELGSLTRDPGYQALVLRRFPNADFTVLVREAYIALGGKISGEPVKVSTQSNQQHIDKSRRASAAVPGRTAPRINESNLIGKLSNRAAMAKAIELHRGE